jgi:hypothetical protein
VAFEQLSAVLRSPHLAGLERHQCLRLDLWLREHNVGELQPGCCPGCCSRWRPIWARRPLPCCKACSTRFSGG